MQTITTLAGLGILVSSVALARRRPTAPDSLDYGLELDTLESLANPGPGFVTVQTPAQWGSYGHFQASEFPRPDRMSHEILAAVDALREAAGVPFTVSPAPGATVRLSGNPASRHYAVGRLSDAVDVLVPPGVSLRELVDLARIAVPAIGGIGVYPHWQPSHGLHLDARPRKPSGDLYTWGGVLVDGAQRYVSLETALA